jgi:YHS domain-containing protein
MFRALLELIITILVAMVARALISSIMKGFGNASSQAFRADQPPQQQPNAAPQNGRELHKDPVCGTYVADSTTFRRQIAGNTFYYCSESCRARHALAAK